MLPAVTISGLRSYSRQYEGGVQIRTVQRVRFCRLTDRILAD